MTRVRTGVFLLAGAFSASVAQAQDGLAEKRMAAVRGIVTAVNSRDADAYVANLAEDVVVRLYEGEVRVRGRQALRDNRIRHFERYPRVRNELIHLVAIEDRVIMHDRVWLDRSAGRSVDVVEVYTFDVHDRIVLVDVIQPRDLLARGAQSGQ